MLVFDTTINTNVIKFHYVNIFMIYGPRSLITIEATDM